MFRKRVGTKQAKDSNPEKHTYRCCNSFGGKSTTLKILSLGYCAVSVTDTSHGGYEN